MTNLMLKKSKIIMLTAFVFPGVVTALEIKEIPKEDVKEFRYNDSTGSLIRIHKVCIEGVSYFITFTGEGPSAMTQAVKDGYFERCESSK
ncbi:hypothetical protein IQ22_04549 [Pseudomonas duriflava]|uniref:Uncharacterized protein n=1 Tax=Pseudomonas duriflava TaxID=459528 RepID=A0A562PP18_9PSED|nr:hypothetical protein [Pseudomonas duriflava]TWI46174.1 hypothetical protein IQ22_04549 [Pseudomonas duriflava]